MVRKDCSKVDYKQKPSADVTHTQHTDRTDPQTHGGVAFMLLAVMVNLSLWAKHLMKEANTFFPFSVIPPISVKHTVCATWFALGNANFCIVRSCPNPQSQDDYFRSGKKPDSECADATWPDCRHGRGPQCSN